MTSPQPGFRITSNMRSFNKPSPSSTVLSFGRVESTSKISGSVLRHEESGTIRTTLKSSPGIRREKFLSTLKSEAHAKNKAIHDKKVAVLMRNVSEFKDNSLLFALTQPNFFQNTRSRPDSRELSRKKSGAKLDESQHSFRTTTSQFKSEKMRATDSVFGKFETLVERLKVFGRQRPPSMGIEEEVRESKIRFEPMKLISFSPSVLELAVFNIDRNPKLQKWINDLESTLQKAKGQLDSIRESHRKAKLRMAWVQDQVKDAGRPDEDLEGHKEDVERVEQRIVEVDRQIELVYFEQDKLEFMKDQRATDNRMKKRFLSTYKNVLPEIINYLEVRQKEFENQVNSIDKTYRQITAFKKEGEFWHELAVMKSAEANFEEEKDKDVKRILAYEREYKELEKERKAMETNNALQFKAQKEEEHQMVFLKQLQSLRDEINEYAGKEAMLCEPIGAKNLKELLRHLENTRETKKVVMRDKAKMEDELKRKKAELEALKQKRNEKFLYCSENPAKIHGQDHLKMIEMKANNSMRRQNVRVFYFQGSFKAAKLTEALVALLGSFRLAESFLPVVWIGSRSRLRSKWTL